MTKRMDITGTTGGDVNWAPTSDSIIQLDAVDPTAKIEIMARVDALAPWVKIEELDSLNRIFVRVAKFAGIRALVIRNGAAAALKVWDVSL